MSVLRRITYRCSCIVLLVAGIFILSAQTSVREYQIKAVFLFNFTQFIEWPAPTLPAAQTPIVIGILGEDPFGPFLDQTLSGEKVDGHPIVIQRYSQVEEIKICHILFINAKEKNKFEKIIANLKGRSILTVSDAANFIQQGGMIRFFTVNNKIQFQINPDAAQSVDLKISSKLLRLATIVIPNKK